MSEADVIQEIVEFTNILLFGISVLFSIISAYVVALNYFVGEAPFPGKAASFAFVSLILGLLALVMMGAEQNHAGLMARLVELRDAGQLTAAGKAVLKDAIAPGNPGGGNREIDALIRFGIWAGLAAVYCGLFYLTFIHRWKPDVYRVAVQKGVS